MDIINAIWDATYTLFYEVLKKRIANETFALILAVFLSLLLPVLLVGLLALIVMAIKRA